MVVFKTVSFKNFLSVGNAPVEIDLMSSKKVLITGANGNGKSTILNAISFALFNKAIKSLNKGGLVNSINNKNCLVEITFSIGKKDYLVRRGVKPNIFEIFENGKLVDQPGVVDYQQYLETKILQTNFRAFTQTTVISIENNTPFMQLRSHERREFIEELLDIKVFSTMNTLLKQHMNDVKEEIRNLEIHIKLTKEKAILQKKHIEQMETIRDSHVKDIENKIVSCETDIVAITSSIEQKNLELAEIEEQLNNLEKEKQKAEEFLKVKNKLEHTLSGLVDKTNFYHDADNCPTCKQDIGKDHKDHLISETEEKRKKVEEAISDIISNKLSKLSELNDNINDRNKSIRQINSEIYGFNTSISQINKMIREHKQEIDKHKNKNESIEEQKDTLKKIAKETIALSERKAELSEQSQYHDIAYGLLKDSGIKAKIIKQYIPLINKYVNKYLNELDFFIAFELDENFNETLKSRHRDTFTYFNFSAGEQQRIDLSLMMTWRQIARMKNSFNSNILFLDEVLDRVDSIGFDLLVNIFNSTEMESTNIFVVSHKPKDTLAEIFDTMIEMRKDKHGFSEAVVG